MKFLSNKKKEFNLASYPIGTIFELQNGMRVTKHREFARSERIPMNLPPGVVPGAHVGDWYKNGVKYRGPNFKWPPDMDIVRVVT